MEVLLVCTLPAAIATGPLVARRRGGYSSTVHVRIRMKRRSPLHMRWHCSCQIRMTSYV